MIAPRAQNHQTTDVLVQEQIAISNSSPSVLKLLTIC